MFFINNRFGNKKWLLEYSGLPKDTIIPGEIQHGYWTKEKWLVHRSTTSSFLKTYLWGGQFARMALTKNSNAYLPIGDPFLYFLHFLKKEKKSVLGNLLLPRFEAHKSDIHNKKSYDLFLNRILDIGIMPNTIRLHPRSTLNNSHRNIGPLHSKSISVLENLDPGNQHYYQTIAEEYLNSDIVITDYLGPHILRSNQLQVNSILIVSLDSHENNIIPKYIPTLYRTKDFKVYSNCDEKFNKFLKFEIGEEYKLTNTKLVEMLRIEDFSQQLLKNIYNTKLNLARTRNLILVKPKFYDQLFETCPHCYSNLEIFMKRCKYCLNRIL